jgi:Domain of unknown function (DUF4926)
MIKELDVVTLKAARQQDKLATGDVGTVVMVHNDGAGFTVEFMTAEGRTTAIVDVLLSEIEPASPQTLARWRNATAAAAE